MHKYEAAWNEPNKKTGLISSFFKNFVPVLSFAAGAWWSVLTTEPVLLLFGISFPRRSCPVVRGTGWGVGRGQGPQAKIKKNQAQNCEKKEKTKKSGVNRWPEFLQRLLRRSWWCVHRGCGGETDSESADGTVTVSEAFLLWGGQTMSWNAHGGHHLRQLFIPLHTVSIIYFELQ